MKDAIEKLIEARNGLRASARAHDERGYSEMSKYLFERAQLIDDALNQIQARLKSLRIEMDEDSSDDARGMLQDRDDYSQSRAALR